MGQRLTIGFLDEDAYDEYHNMLAKGLSLSAQEHDIQVIRFGHFLVHFTTINPYHVEILHQFISQFKLDGLLFLGWARATQNPHFREFFGDIPMVSVGSCLDGIPGVSVSGRPYIKEILQHLIEVHKFSKIAYVAPFWPDDRVEAYLEVMDHYHLYNPELYVSEMDLQNLSVKERGRRTVEILLDERQADVEAIVSLYNEETSELIGALQERGIRVPDDIAITSYEDGDIGHFSNPSMTTVCFPWQELGYHGGEVLFKLISEGSVPDRTEVPSRVIYRNSCGCMAHADTVLKTGHLQWTDTPFESLTQSELDEIAGSFSENTTWPVEETRHLLSQFRQAFHDGADRNFLLAFEGLLRKMATQGWLEDAGQFSVLFRQALLPYFIPYWSHDTNKIIWAEDLFHQMQLILQNRLATARFREDLEYNKIKLALKEVGQILITHFHVDNLMDSLGNNLHRIGVRSCYLYLFDQADPHRLFDDYHLAFAYRDGKRMTDLNGADSLDARKFNPIWFREERPGFLLAHLLYMGDEFIGFILFEPTQMDIRIYRALGLQISTALNEINLFEKLDNSYRMLMDQAHRQGMADTTGILHNIANIMNSVNVTAQSLEELLSRSALNDLRRANEMLGEKQGELDDFIRHDPKGKLLMQYYVSLSDEFDDFRSGLQTYIGRLTDKIGLIEEIINTQQTYAEVKSSLEHLDIIPIIEDVLKTYQTSIEKHAIRVIRTYGQSAPALVQRTKLFHILTNIIKNAIESMEDTEKSDRELTVSITPEAGNIFVRISDRGAGIAEENLERIFAYGFTTKRGGHGFGLHSCANYMTEMKGRIWAENVEHGSGAAFVLQFKAPPDPATGTLKQE